MEKVSTELKKLLKSKPYLRNASDLRLCKYYATRIDGVKSILDIKTNFETITRSRRKLVEKYPEQYAPTSKRVRNARKSKENAVKRWSQK
jgi:hypothetical protein